MRCAAECLVKANELEALAAGAQTLAGRAELIGLAKKWRTAAVVILYQDNLRALRQIAH